MYKSIDIDAAVEHLKNIYEHSRCCVCDKTGGSRFRYACGHTSCDDCVLLAAECSLCLTPPVSTSEPILDNPLTQRAANAVNLLNVFENEFHIDVYKRQRISEQQKVEREIFPECIQAPVKYTNKRKSFNNSVNKENRLSQLPGEEISPIGHRKMEKSENVEIWLNKYVRKPFADLNSNDKRLNQDTEILRNKQNIQNDENTPKKSTRKRSYFKSALSTIRKQTLIVDHLSPVKKTQNTHKKPRIELTPVKPDTSKNKTSITENDESGIAMADEAVIVIDDSQNIGVDKDYNAWLAVQEADRNRVLSSSEINTRSIEVTPPKQRLVDTEIKVMTKVPFYRKGCLSKQYIDCYSSDQLIKDSEYTESMTPTSNVAKQANDVSITVQNKSFIATITIKQDQSTSKPNTKQSIKVQTDITEAELLRKENVDKKICEESQQAKSQDDMKPEQNSQDDEKIENPVQDVCMKYLKKTGNVVIEESDSDDDIEPSLSMEVKAQIHRSCEEVDYGILADIDDMDEHGKRARRGPRGLTPTSTDSSEKENYNPNRMKKTTFKKKPNKK